MQLQARSLGFEIDVWKSQHGAVHSCFDRAINLSIEGELWTVLGVGQPEAPFGVGLAVCDQLADLGVQAGDRVFVRAGYLRLGPRIVDCRSARHWTLERWGMPVGDLAARLCHVERVAEQRAWAGSASLAAQLAAALRGSDADLERALRRSVGRGPGLTPSGDDVLVGMLAVLTATGSADAARLAGALAPLLRTTPDISRHLLLQAARGQPGRAIHMLGKALCEGAEHEPALDAVLATGSTSGADASLGLVAACRLSFLPAERLAS
ncbi:MAG TPA: DUF2877 domain-containing protein [Polyangiales bacterium]|nr:DUF2877 domain-containing protein [Polyangiales bacterium]